MKKILLTFLFALSLHSMFAQCAGTQTMTVNPAPSAGNYYNPGQVVNFCETVSGYTQNCSDWFHGLSFSFGNAWDLSTFTTVSLPTSCDGGGSWGYYPAGQTSSSSGLYFGAGFYYDSMFGGPLDGNPGNNYGDDNISNCSWTFCWSIQVSTTATAGQSCALTATVSGDGASGSWGPNNCCSNEPALTLSTATVFPCTLTMNTNVVNPTCANNNGSIEVIPQGATYPVVYTWNNGQPPDSLITGLAAGSYTITVTDAFGCSTSQTFNLNFVNNVTFNTQFTNANCFGFCDGSATVLPLTGTAPFSYQWNTGATSQTISGICPGNYTCTLTDADMCTQTANFTITEPPQIILQMSEIDVLCNGGTDGSASVNASGGMAGFTYLWDPSSSTASTAPNLTAGTYSVTVTDVTGCIATDNITVNQPTLIQIAPTVTDPTCNGFNNGLISVIPSQGTPPYVVTWSVAGQTGTTLDSVAAGNYTVFVTDANGCVMPLNINVAEPALLTGVLTPNPASCPAASDGIMELAVNGGTTPYNYLWSHDPGLNTNTAPNLPAGNYSVTVTDAKGCTITLSEDITTLPDFIVNAGKDTSIELGTSALLVAVTDRPTSTFKYYWNPQYHLGDAFAPYTTAYPYVDTMYQVLAVEDNSGCMDTDDVRITILPTSYVMVPNAFTPNGDGINDVLTPIAGELVTVTSFKIFNRWGREVFAGKGTDGWNGTALGVPAEMGSFVYFLTYSVEGRAGTQMIKGNITLLR